MHGNVLIGILLAVAIVVPVFAWFFYLWYRAHITQMHQEYQFFDRRNRDRAQAHYERGMEDEITGPYFTPRGWVRPKTRGLSHVLHPPQYVHLRQPISTGIPHSDQLFQGPNRATAHSPQTVNQQPNPLSKRQKRKQRAIQNKQRQKEQQQSQIEQGRKQNRKDQRKQKNKSQGQNQQKSPTGQPPRTQSPGYLGQDVQNNQWGITGQHYRTRNHYGGSAWANDQSPREYQQSSGQNDRNNQWDRDSNNAQGRQRTSVSNSPRRNSRDNQKNHDWGQHINSRSPQWDNEKQDDHRNSSHQNGWNDSRHASPDRASRHEVESRRSWGQRDDGAHQDDHSRSHHLKEVHHDRSDAWGVDDAKGYRYASPEGKSRRSSPNRDWAHNDYGERGNSRDRSNSWGHAEEPHGSANESWAQDGNMHRDKKKKGEKKERWQIELEENEKGRRSRSPSGGSGAGFDKRSQASGWKKTQKW